MSVTEYANGNITVTTQDNLIVSPMVTDYAPTSEINTTSELVERVTMTGIDRIFKRELSEADSKKLLEAFTVSGFMLDPTLSEVDPNVESLSVALSNSGAFAEVIRDAVAAATDASDDLVNWAGAAGGAVDAAGAGVKIRQYLETRLRNAFFTYFASSLGALTLDAGWASGAGGTIMQLSGNDETVSGESAAGVVNASGGDSTIAQPKIDAIGSTTAYAETTLTGFTVGVDVSETAMGNACAQRHGTDAGAANDRIILFRQIRKATWSKYYDGSANTLNTDALPMEKGQSFVVVFDIDIASSSARSDSGAKAEGFEGLPVIGTAQAGARNYQLNMGNRRVAFELQLTAGSGIFTGMRAHPAKATAPGYVAPAPGGMGGL